MQPISAKNIIDYFKLFKIFDLKKIDKHGDVKLTQDKSLARKVLHVDGNVSTQNYIIFDHASISTPGMYFSQQYLYIVGYLDHGKNFCFQLTLHLNAKIYKVLYSTVYKTPKMTSAGVLQMPIQMATCKWTVIVIDLFELCEKYSEIDEIRMSFKLAAIEIRANSKIKNIYQSDTLYDPHSMPKQMELPKKTSQNFYSLYNYIVVGQNKKEKEQENNRQINVKESDQVSKNQMSIIQVKKKHDQGPKNEKQILSKQKSEKRIQSSKIAKNSKIMSKKNKNMQPSKSQTQSFINQAQITQLLDQQIPRQNVPPRPKVTIQADLVALEGSTLTANGISALGAFITHPILFAVHKQIKCMSTHPTNPLKLIVGYLDGSICLWDTLRQKSLFYLQTQLKEIRLVQISGEGDDQKVFLFGSDKMKRQIILILNSQDVLFKQVSTYSINNFALAHAKGEELLISFGFENIRLWKLNPKNCIITGVGLYLGKMNRNVHYNSGCVIGEDKVLVADSSGYINRICLKNERMEEMKKISQNGLDHIVNIKEWSQVLVAETSGNIKIMTYELEMLEEFQLGNRIRSLSYQIRSGNLILHINNYNRTLSQFNVTTSQYRYLSRQHSGAVLALAYMSKLSKVVSISKDNTIRIWGLQMATQSTSPTPWQLKQQYQFLINSGESMTCLIADHSQHAYIGFTGGIIRKIDVNNFQILREETVIFQNSIEDIENTKITSIDISKNGKNLLVCCQYLAKDKLYPNGQTIKKTYVALTDLDLNILFKFQCPAQSNNATSHSQVLAVFNISLKKIAICWTYGSINRIQSFSLANPSEIKSEFYLHSTPRRFLFKGKFIESHGICDKNQDVLQIYDEETGQMTQMLGLQKNWQGQCMISYPICFSCNSKQQVQISGVQAGNIHHNLRQYIDMPEKVSNFTIGQQSQANLLFCSGQQSNALYGIRYQVRNIEELLAHNKNQQTVQEDQQLSQYMQNHKKQEHNFSNISSVVKTGNNNKMCGNMSENEFMGKFLQSEPKMVMGAIEEDEEDQNESMIDFSHKQMKSIYHQEEKIFEQVKHVLIPQHQSSNQEQVEQQYNPHAYMNEYEHTKGVHILYGWQTTYSKDPDLQPQRLIWIPTQQAAIFVSSRTLIRHQFRQPVKQSILRLPTVPSLVIQLGRYLAVSMGNQLRIYSHELGYMRGMSALGTVIRSVAISQCQGFAIVLSCNTQHTYIQVIDILTCNSVCNSYLAQVKSGWVKLVVNPYQKCLQFVAVWGDSFRFYRMTSIMTLQTQQDEEVAHVLNNTDSGDIHSVAYLKLAQEQLILIGTRDGSLIIVDSRTASILIMCRNVVNYPITDILHCFDQNSLYTVALVGQSNSVTTYVLEQLSVRELIGVLDKKAHATLTADSQIMMHSSIHCLSQNAQGMLVMTKFGVLWLFDLTGCDTIKISSVHTSSSKGPFITKCLSFNDNQIITGGSDGTVKCTSLWNLQQNYQVYKPRKTVKDILLCNDMMIVAFDNQVCFYVARTDPLSQKWKYLGVVNFCTNKTNNSQKIISIKNIPYSDNYFVCTNTKLFIVYHHRGSTTLKVEMQEICGDLHNAVEIDVLGYNHVLVKSGLKIDVWVRKQKRNERPLDQLSKVQELKYYMMDAYQTPSIHATFVTEEMDKGSVNRQYIVLLASRPIIQWRDFTEHAIIREIQIGVKNPTCMRISNSVDFLVGDQNGVVWCVKENGLTLEKEKAIDGPIQGLQQMSNGNILAYGQQVGIVKLC